MRIFALSAAAVLALFVASPPIAPADTDVSFSIGGNGLHVAGQTARSSDDISTTIGELPTTTSLPEDDEYCRVFFEMAPTPGLKSLGFEVAYDTLDGRFLGVGEDAICRRLVAAESDYLFNANEFEYLSLFFVFPDPAIDDMPVELASCLFAKKLAAAAPQPEDFEFLLFEAKDQDEEEVQPLPALRVSGVECGVATTTTTTTTSTTTTTTTTLKVTTSSSTSTSVTVLPPTTSSTLPFVPCGDPNADGRFTAADALYVLRAAVGSLTCPASVCDVQGRNGINAADALLLLRIAVGLLTPDTVDCP
jgi:hypothetical protein